MENGHKGRGEIPKSREGNFHATADTGLENGQESLSTLANGVLEFEPSFLGVFGKESFGFGVLVMIL